MASNLILMAGLPASGKSSFAEYAAKELCIPIIEKDEIKEFLFDAVGFRSHDEKTKLDIAASNTMMYTAGRILDSGNSVILDNNFESRNLENLSTLISKHPCNVVTVRFNGDVSVIYQRFLKRDKDPNRHPGHVLVTCYPPVEGVEDEGKLITLKALAEKFRKRGTLDFQVGKLIEVDATDFSKVSYPEILGRLKAVLATGKGLQVVESDRTGVK